MNANDRKGRKRETLLAERRTGDAIPGDVELQK